MFRNLVYRIREWVRKMFGRDTLERAIGNDIATSQDMLDAIQLWAKLYKNEAEWLTTEISSLNIPAAIASEIARMSVVELEVDIEGSDRAEFLAEQFEKVMNNLREQIEYGVAKGGLMMKPYVDGDHINIDYVQADEFFPTKFDNNGNIIACVFVDQRVYGKEYYTRLEHHEHNKDNYHVKNVAFKSATRDDLGREIPLTEVDDWAELLPEATITNIEKPLFAYFRYPFANTIDTSSPLGVSCYARSVDLIEQADTIWSNLLWEFDSGQRALYVDSLAFKRDDDGNAILPHKRLYRTIDAGGQADALFEVWSPEFREQSIITGLDTILKRIEFNCGLASGTISDPNHIALTATEIVTSKQRTYSTVTEVQKAVKLALTQLFYAMDMWATISKLSAKGAYEVTFRFDDSVIVDANERFQQDLTLVNAMIMGKVEFRVRNLGETEEIAKKKVAEIMADMKAEQSLFPSEE